MNVEPSDDIIETIQIDKISNQLGGSSIPKKSEDIGERKKNKKVGFA